MNATAKQTINRVKPPRKYFSLKGLGEIGPVKRIMMIVRIKKSHAKGVITYPLPFKI